jgi:glycosyl transferase, family 25
MVVSQAAKTLFDIGAEDGAREANDPLPSPEMYVINLDRSPERMRQFHQVNAHLPHVNRFAAVDGQTVNYATLLEQQIFGEPIFCKIGSVGVTLSHRQLWSTAAARSEYITIFEDDAIIHKDFPTLAPALIAELPHDWDIVLWGWNFDAAMSARSNETPGFHA